MHAVYSALRQGYIYILSRIDRLAALKGVAEPRKRRLKAQWFYMSKIIYLFIYLFIVRENSLVTKVKVREAEGGDNTMDRGRAEGDSSCEKLAMLAGGSGSGACIVLILAVFVC